MKSNENKRRRFLQLGLGATAGILTTAIGCKNSGSETAQAGSDPTNCNITPDQALGPFYPHIKNGDGDVDLTRIQGKEGQAEGAVLLVRGTIRDENCRPIENALVEIWQANHHGRYSHEGDAGNPRPLDPNFEGWGEMTTDASGSYGFKTIKPAAYPFGDPEKPKDWRTPHLHFKISRRGYHEVVTQMCFEGEELNETDIVLGELPDEERAQFILSPEREEGSIPVFIFNLTLKKVTTYSERIAALDACTGKYDFVAPNQAPAVFHIRRDGSQLYLDIEGYTSVELKMIANDDYKSDALTRRFVFHRNNEGSVEGMTVHSISKFEKMEPVMAPKTG